MPERIDYDYLWKLLQEEKQTNALLPIAKDFYSSATKLISGNRHDATQDNTEKANVAKILLDLFERRKQKILLYIAYGKQLPAQVDSHETEFYDALIKIVKAEKLAIEDKHNKVVLRAVKDIPEIILPSGSKIGPLAKGDVVEADSINDDMNFLLNNAICEKL
ncbi:MAG: hypothetical protein ACP5UH_01480 [Candidatus Micrarchaeia archaeon]